jgi:beta-lactamase regulating signal transducer with metallopeptidase domain
MNAIQILATQPWVERLGLTLLHFLWQGLIIAIVYACARRWGARTTGPNGRYLLACSALTAMAIAPLATWMVPRVPVAESVAVTFTAPMSAAQTEPVRFIPVSPPTRADRAMSAPFLSWVVAIWFTGATAFSLRLLFGWILAERLRSGMARPASADWQRTLDRLKTRVSVSGPVRLLVSGALHAPAAIGWLRPIVLVPVGALTGLPAAQMEALLIHELAHIRRHDYLLHILQSAVEAIFFYHPAVWWISSHMRTERELCCDDVAVSLTGDPVIYARALAEFDSARWMKPAVMAANGGSLASRIARLLGQPSTSLANSRRASCGPGTASALILLATGAWVLFAQPTVRPQFEVASVKPSFSRSVQNVRPIPGRLTADATLQILIQYAYGVQPFQVVGGPNGPMSTRYQIDARADALQTATECFSCCSRCWKTASS